MTCQWARAIGDLPCGKGSELQGGEPPKYAETPKFRGAIGRLGLHKFSPQGVMAICASQTSFSPNYRLVADQDFWSLLGVFSSAM